MERKQGSVCVVPASLVRLAGAAGKALCWAAFARSAAKPRVWLQPALSFAEKADCGAGARTIVSRGRSVSGAFVVGQCGRESGMVYVVAGGSSDGTMGGQICFGELRGAREEETGC